MDRIWQWAWDRHPAHFRNMGERGHDFVRVLVRSRGQVPLTVGAAFALSLRPIRDLADGTERVAAGDYSQRLPVVQDDDLGALAASFNRMQAGLAERQRLRLAFGTYVDPVLIDIRDFTPFAEANTAEDTVARLNVAARVEQLTKTTNDAILLTHSCVGALARQSPELVDRGSHVLKGKSAPVQVFGLDPGE